MGRGIRETRRVYLLRCYLPPVLAGLITALMYAVVQQHWKPPPPTPDESLPSMRMMYSPGSEKVAVVLTRSFSIVGVLSANLISPGPRYFVSVVLTRGRRGGALAPPGGGAVAEPPVGGSSLPSSETQYLMVTPSPTAP